MSIQLKKIPITPGIYKFFSNNEIIYIGKAKNLKRRVSSYFSKSLKDRKTTQIKLLTDKVETFTTKNEVEALLLEQSLIKENKPKFNILLRDDKTYPYIYFSLDHNYPGIYFKRTKNAVDKRFIGPFISAEAVKKSIKEIQKIFKIRNCSDSTFTNRSRPCIEFQMKRCSAPCVKRIKEIDYLEDISSAKSFLSSSNNHIIKRLKNDIKKEAAMLNFEKAAEIRDQLNRLNSLKDEQSVVTLANDVDIFSVHSEMTYLGISIIVVRNGKIRGTKTHLIKQGYYDDIENVYQSAIVNFYEHQSDIPKKILCSISLNDKNLLEEMFIEKHQKKVKIIKSPNKSIRPIFNLCKLNARQVINNHITKEDKYTYALKELAKYTNLKDINKIEAYDVSHISGEHAVASCVVFSKEGPKKNKYRLFNIPNHLSGNDIGSLEHAIERRVKYYNDLKVKPNLILVDGGRTQLKFVNSVIQKTNHKDIKVISIVKGSNRFRATETIISDSGVIELDKYSKSFLLLQEIRDEAHRFAISAQRRKKRKKVTISKLDNINGIGKTIKRRLLTKYGSTKKISNLSKKDLMTINGINEKIANKIKANLR